eukprot:13728992-Alexandrium_andersonii.AAC.1
MKPGRARRHSQGGSPCKEPHVRFGAAEIVEFETEPIHTDLGDGEDRAAIAREHGEDAETVGISGDGGAEEPPKGYRT